MSVSLIDGHIDREKQKHLIYIPKDGNYVEILGYKIDGFESFEVFCEHLNKYAEMEEEINRKNEQIEALIAGQETLQKALNEKLEENADLSIKLEKWLDKYNEKNIEIVKLSHNIQSAKSEAVKEFADLAIKRICENVTPIPQQKYLISMCIQEIDNLVKEMVGEK